MLTHLTTSAIGQHAAEDVEDVIIRPALVRDVPAVAEIINKSASEGLMLPRSQYDIYQSIRDFVLALEEGTVIGCCALHVVWADIAEVRSLAVLKHRRGRGLGRRLVEALLGEARRLGLPRVFALTYQQRFFEKLGFRVVPRESLPHKIWRDCLDCPTFPKCDETAMILELQTEEDDS